MSGIANISLSFLPDFEDASGGWVPPWPTRQNDHLLELEVEVKCDLVRHIIVHRRGCYDFLV